MARVLHPGDVSLKYALALVCLASISGCIGAKSSEVVSLSQMDDLGAVPAFSLAAHDGSTVSLDSLKGKVSVLDFFFSNCKGVCPAMTSNMKQIRESFKDDTRVFCVSISVDTKRDTAAHLAEYWKQNGSLSDWKFLTGEQKDIYNLARNGLSLGASEVPGELVHSDRFVLIDKSGEIRGYYHGTDSDDITRLEADIRSLLK